jgi:hypothetical protein
MIRPEINRHPICIATRRNIDHAVSGRITGSGFDEFQSGGCDLQCIEGNSRIRDAFSSESIHQQRLQHFRDRSARRLPGSWQQCRSVAKKPMGPMIWFARTRNAVPM